MPRKLFTIALFALGALLLAVAAATSSAAIERSLLGEFTGQLRWGPGLFRALLAWHGFVLIVAAIWRVYHLRNLNGVQNRNFAPAARPSSRASWAALAALCAIALALRLWRLNTCLWIDEMFTMVDFLLRPMGEIVTSFPSQNQHMLYSVCGRLSILAFGESAAAARLPAVLFGVAGLWALFLLGRRTIGAAGALLACAILTVSYHHVWFSQNARGYSALLFFSTLSTYLWLEALQRGTPRWWCAYAISVALGLWAHMTLIFVVAAHGVTFLLLPWRSPSPAAAPPPGSNPTNSGDAPGPGPLPAFRGKALLTWLIAATATLQLHALSLPEFLSSALHEESLPSVWTDPIWVVEETLRRLRDGGLSSLTALAGLAVLAAGFAGLLRRDWRAALVMTLPAVLGGGTMIALQHNLWPRFFFFCLGFIVLIAVRGVQACAASAVRLLPASAGTRRRLAASGATAACLLVVAASAWTLPRAYALPKQDFIGARDFVEQSRQPGDPVAAVGLAGAAYGRYFAPQWPFPRTPAEIAGLRASGGTLWLVYTLEPQLKAWYPDIWKMVQEKFETVKVFPGTLGDGAVVVCRWRS